MENIEENMWMKINPGWWKKNGTLKYVMYVYKANIQNKKQTKV